MEFSCKPCPLHREKRSSFPVTVFQLHQVGIYQEPWLKLCWVVGVVRVMYLLRMAKMTSESSLEPYSPMKIKACRGWKWPGWERDKDSGITPAANCAVEAIIHWPHWKWMQKQVIVKHLLSTDIVRVYSYLLGAWWCRYTNMEFAIGQLSRVIIGHRGSRYSNPVSRNCRVQVVTDACTDQFLNTDSYTFKGCRRLQA